MSCGFRSGSCPRPEGARRRIDQLGALPVTKKNKSGSWFVSVTTGYGPDSYIGDFQTEKDAQRWISTKLKYWPPSKPDPAK
jgi:hypothetical protein